MTAAGVQWPWRDALADLLRRSRLAQPDGLAAEVNAALAPLGLEARIYLVDQEQRTLRPVPRPGGPPPGGLAVDSTVPGRVFTTVEPASLPATDTDPARLWLPLLDGTERLGVLEVTVRGGTPLDDPDLLAGCDLFTQLVGHLIATKLPYGDALLKVRRTRRMSEASELLWRLLPPLTFACDRAVVAAILEPCYEVGGDGFDYAADGSTLYFAIFDTAGHHLRAGLGTAVVMSAIRAARRSGDGLYAMARAADRALEEHLPELRFTTAVLAQLDLQTGRLRYVNAGHPRPLLIRGGKVVRSLDGGRRMPLGLDDPRTEVAHLTLERGDRLLLFSDGITEARDRAGAAFGIERLTGLVERGTGDLPAPEALRRLCHAALSHYDGPPSDDATLVLVEWSDEAARAMLPSNAQT
ncbi:serine/threonine-protein phosphatase [Dactylosporangium aurantiacum]|uniref:Serine/threonine-protein phosphatase n=1 Tax=Dactylosporangium aurantiacum TaxID=35754 RepID=A0A9Q9ISG1_9ACTN|nr:PP2C family protein-serine/threonine phosphatase [Dactylosporangium aurantiacum]MDG6103809.1 PP2C family protein-serine/threonine phosphatase [Dactylosporangium aurantiacum]UWZ58987.1 serine/threonine-protein phosphatase [Dactylosporangium aurantiacum]